MSLELLKLNGIDEILLYLRKSRRDEARERKTGEDTLAEQDRLMTRVMEDYGLPYIKFQEVASGERIDKRPEFQKIIKLLKEGRYKSIAVKEISRLGRGNYTDMGVIFDLLQEKRIFIVTPYKVYDPENFSDLRQIRFELFLAREEFETIRERLVGARYSSAKSGRWMSTVPYGFDRNPTTMRLEPNEEQAKIVRWIFDWYVNEGLGQRAIKVRLSEIGVNPPRTDNDFWDEATIKRLLENEAYIGTSHYGQTKYVNGKIIPRPENQHIKIEDAHDAIVDKEIWLEAQNIRSAKKKMPRNAQNQYDNPDYQPHELTGIIRCADCGKTLVINNSKSYVKSDGEKVIVKQLRCKNGCATVKYDVVLEYVEGLLAYLKRLDKKALEEYMVEYESLQSKMQREAEQHDVEIKDKLTLRIEELEEELKNLRKLLRKGTIDEKEYEQDSREVKEQIARIKEAMGFEEVSAASELYEQAEAFIEALNIYQKCKDSKQKNIILSNLFDHIRLRVLEKGRNSVPARCELKPSFIFNPDIPEMMEERA